QNILLMPELTPYVERPVDAATAVAAQDATLAWTTTLTTSHNNTNKSRHKTECVSAEAEYKSSAGDHLLPQLTHQHYTDILFNINFSLKKGELVAVCGGVGAGKSSLLSALLGHMHLRSGQVFLQGSCAYVSQQSWIINASFRDNILLDLPFDAMRYYRVIHACNLNQDIATLAAGDFTEVGERGINLSGGQKQRLSLARAIYANKDVYLLDDAMSAVDSHVGNHIFQWVMKAALKDKTVVFVTHQLQYAAECDRIMYVRDGRVVEQGTHSQLMKDNGDYAALYTTHMSTVHQDSDQTSSPLESVRVRQDSVMSQESDQSSSYSYLADGGAGSTHVHHSNIDEGEGKLTTKERLDKGDIATSTYQYYIKAAGGYVIITLVILTFILNVGSTAFSSWWLSLWLSAGSGNTTVMIGNVSMISENIADNPDCYFYQTVYGSFILIILTTSLIRGFVFMKTTLVASSRMHDQVFMKVLRSPMTFFDTTPCGRIINIFSRDMDEVDVRVPINLENLLQNMCLIVSSLVFVCLVFPHFLPFLVLLACIFLYIRNIFRIGIRDFKRLENISRSPLYSHISTTLNGLASINAYGKQKMFTQKFMMLFDENTSLFYLFNCAMRWLAVRLDLLAMLVTSCTAVLTLLLRGSVEASFAGLALAYSAQLSGIFQYTVRLSSETEARFTSVQRIMNYSKGLQSEAPPIIESRHPEVTWPQYGRVSFRKVQMRYRPETPLVLKGVTFHIDSMENIGVVGRTGSGKSSLGVVLFRLVELAGGTVRIDGTDISTLGLEDLRSRLSIIPQDPVLFIGTIRYNLDPFHRHSDEEIWSALDQTFMKNRIASLNLKLSAPVVENGENFSIGERQLLCMARALLRKSK
ncbi:hypothetical protein OTU49_016157, partial [Cherax quadricarinatus]